MSRRDHPFILVTGGCRSGKSAFAETALQRLAPAGLYIATAQSHDEEMRRRIDEHRQRRGIFWTTFEPQKDQLPDLDLHLPDSAKERAVLFDCLTLWVSGCMDIGLDDQAILGSASRLFETLLHLPVPVALVSNETGMGLVPPTPLGRRFRDISGLINQMAAQKATDVVFMVSGLPMPIKGGLYL